MPSRSESGSFAEFAEKRGRFLWWPSGTDRSPFDGMSSGGGVLEGEDFIHSIKVD